MQAGSNIPATRYQRRVPEATVLYGIVREHLSTFLARSAAAPDRPGLPRHVRRELERFLDCGLLCRGFVRVLCEQCHESMLVAFSCKARAVCPSCTGRRMAELSAHLVDHVLPEVPVRQWVLSLPHAVRFLLARDPALCRLVRGIFVRAVQSFYRRRARDQGRPGGRCGAVVCTQRSDSALRLDIHFHALVLDGVYTGFGHGESPTFHAAEPLRDEEVEALVRHIHALVIGQLRRRGLLDQDQRLDPDTAADLDVLGTCQAAAIQGLIPFGQGKGHRTEFLDEDPLPRQTPTSPKKLCADHIGFSLHAAIRIASCARSRLERLCRYVTRPPFAQDRLSITRKGDVLYRFRHPWRNGKAAVVMDPMPFLARLAAQVPSPRVHGISYYGVLAAAAARREHIVPDLGADHRCGHHAAPRSSRSKVEDESKREPRRARPERRPWAELIRRTFLTDVLACKCGGRRRVLAMVCDPAQIARCLTHLGLPTVPPPRAPPRPVQAALRFS